ncbi:OprO/OprP family phosphate-selective porin [Thermomonas aquatica]|uniref:Porin n=1 Tax=Thermomonas aquatica TaxID=2202149 RepID=A0A5B7ZTE5_9GAMM|nr:OprO/OprP family phosphate-selective porin [Thermomonas aquatica]QDA58230.1 porin [Thermomonas aquatica]
MKLSRRTLSMALLAALAAPAAHAEVPIDVIAGSEVSFEGLLQADANWFHSDLANLNGSATDGKDGDFKLRRAELVLKGKGPGNFEWVLGYDAKADKWLDTNLKYKIGGNSSNFVQFGQFKQPNSLEELSSTKNNDFISKATITNTWAVARRVGVAYGMGDANWSVTGSVFGRELTRNLGAGNGFGLRGTWAPINETGNLLHLGLSYARYDAELGAVGNNVQDTQRWRARPNADLSGVRLVDTGNLTLADKVATTGLEGMWVKGPFKLQGEYMRSTTGRGGSFSDFTGKGAYLSALWNVTGETWGYKAGTPTTPLPNEPESGMWQVGLRYDTIDLNDGSLNTSGATPVVTGVLGGKMDAWTLGANWYLRSNFKLAANYVKVTSSKYNSTAKAILHDDPSVVEFRAQFFW